MLKLILSSGLYPQFGVADEHNNYKSGCDQLFHARVKPFNVLHPNSIFASQPEILQLDSLDILDIPGDNLILIRTYIKLFIEMNPLYPSLWHLFISMNLNKF